MKLFSSKTKEVETDIDKYLEKIEEVAMLFELALKDYFEGKIDRFEGKYKEIDNLESEADNLRRDIKYKLYSYLLIPDARGDVLGLIENLDNVIDVAKKVASHFSIEMPIVFPFLRDDFIELTEIAVKAVMELVRAARAFFKDIAMVNDYINKVYFWEHEADQVEDTLKRKAFRSTEIEKFSVRVHMRYFAERISLLADEAESVCERLSVYAIKRSV
ncbi:MAG: DUF47 domain-containing protein [Spirochaetes bacterium]|nr:MAG: DUF47 domain-containing protein [Spirochaetota bacterium]